MNNKQQMYQNYMMNNNNGTKDNKNLIMGHHPKNQMRSSLHTNTMSNPIQNNSIPFMDNTQLNGANRFYPNDMMRPSGFQSVENIPFNYPEGNDGYFGHSGTFPGTMSVGSNKINMNNINNMNINIINQTYQRSHNSFNEDELINSFRTLNVKRNDHTPTSEKSLYNYYFGNNKGYNSLTNDYEQNEVPMMNQGKSQRSLHMGGIGNVKNTTHSAFNNPVNVSKEMFPADSKGYSSYDQNEYEDQFNLPKGMIKNKGSMHHYDRYFNDNGKTELIKVNKVQSVYNPSNPSIGRFFVIKSIDEDNIHKSIKYRIWCSTIKGNQKLQQAYKEADGQYPIYLFFSVNGSGRFLGLAQMTSEVEYRANFNYWSQNEKWKGFFFLVWVIIKDIPNRVFRNIINELNENKPVTSSRDTQEIHPVAGAQMLKIFNEYPYESSILDDFSFYERRQEFIVKPKDNLAKEDEQIDANIINPSQMVMNNPMPVQKSSQFEMNSKKILKRVNSTDHVLKEHLEEK